MNLNRGTIPGNWDEEVTVWLLHSLLCRENGEGGASLSASLALRGCTLSSAPHSLTQESSPPLGTLRRQLASSTSTEPHPPTTSGAVSRPDDPYDMRPGHPGTYPPALLSLSLGSCTILLSCTPDPVSSLCRGPCKGGGGLLAPLWPWVLHCQGNQACLILLCGCWWPSWLV